MGKYIDLVGLRFGRLLVIKRYDKRTSCSNKILWECICDCGKTTFAVTQKLKSGKTKSCGCYSRDIRIQNNITHNGTGTRLYRIWSTMKTRCYNPKSKTYPYYGGRGITICEEWKSDFSSFQKWAVSHGYSDNLTIDRIDNNMGYSPNNCRWATFHEQRINQRRCEKGGAQA